MDDKTAINFVLKKETGREGANLLSEKIPKAREM
jgi:hypothetical protein